MEPPAKKARKTHVSSPEKATRFPAPTGSPTMSNIATYCKILIKLQHGLCVFLMPGVRSVTELLLKSAQKIYWRVLMLVILTVGSSVLLLSVDEKIESLLLFPIFCQNFMNRKDPNLSDLTGAIQGSLEKKVLVLTLGMLQLCCLMKKICAGCFSYMYILHTLTHNINPFVKHICHSANAHSPSICKVFKWQVES